MISPDLNPDCKSGLPSNIFHLGCKQIPLVLPRCLREKKRGEVKRVDKVSRKRYEVWASMLQGKGQVTLREEGMPNSGRGG